MAYYLDGREIEWDALIKKAQTDYGYDDSIKRTSVAAKILRENGHTVEDRP